jgi:NDP-sugar pyrophosphorylase family protein
MIPALVLTAGLATRLRPLSVVRGKAALPVAGTPLVRRILAQLAAERVSDAVLNLYHLPHTLTSLVGDGTGTGVRVRYSWEVPVLGSAGGPRRALPLLDAPTFLIVNGDTLTDVGVAALVADHKRSGALVTLAAIPNTEPGKYSGLRIEADGAFTGVVPRGSSEPSYHFIGVQVAEAETFSPVSDQAPSESIKALYPSLVSARRGAVRAFVTSASFFDIGTPDDYLQTALLLAERVGSSLHGSNTHVHDTARVERSVLWDDVAVGAGSLLRQCIVTDGVRVPADTSWTGVTMRVPNGELAAGERVIDGIAIGSL